MKPYIFILFMLIMTTVIVAYFTSEEGHENRLKIEALFHNIAPSHNTGKEFSSVSLVSKLFYGYKHKKVSDWKVWIATQDKEVKDHAFHLLKEHLEGEAKHWGNISSEVLDGLEAFEEFGIDEFLHKFLHRISTIWNEYLVAPELYKKALNILYLREPGKAVNFMWSEFTPFKIEGDKAFSQKAELIINTIPENEIYGSEFVADIVNNERVPSSIKDSALRRAFQFKKNGQKATFSKILEPYFREPKKIEQRDYEKEAAYEYRIEILKVIIEKAMLSISSPDMFNTMASLCEANNELQRIVHNKALATISNSKIKLEFNQSMAFNYLPDTLDQKIKIALATRRELAQPQIRDIILKPRLQGSELDSLMRKKNLELPIPPCQEHIFKELCKRLGETDGDICNGIENNALLLNGGDRLRKAYMCHSIAKRAKVELKYFDIKFLCSNSAIFSVKKQIEEAKGLIYIENMESFLHNIDSEDLAISLNTFLTDIQELSRRPDLRFIFSFNHSNAEIEKDTKLKLFCSKHLTKNIADHMEVHTSDNYKKKILNHYAALMEREREDFSEFTDEFHSSHEFTNELEYEFACIEELSTQLLVFGKPTSYLEVESGRKSLFSKRKDLTKY